MSSSWPGEEEGLARSLSWRVSTTGGRAGSLWDPVVVGVTSIVGQENLKRSPPGLGESGESLSYSGKASLRMEGGELDKLSSLSLLLPDRE